MGWQFKWVSSHGTDFNYDFKVSFTPEDARGHIDYNYGEWPHAYEEWPGISVFFKNDAGEAPKGRDERDVEYKMEWIRHVALFRGRGCAQGRARQGEHFRGKAIDLHEFRRVDIAFAYSMT